jgi:hypothetical protein
MFVTDRSFLRWGGTIDSAYYNGAEVNKRAKSRRTRLKREYILHSHVAQAFSDKQNTRKRAFLNETIQSWGANLNSADRILWPSFAN